MSIEQVFDASIKEAEFDVKLTSTGLIHNRVVIYFGVEEVEESDIDDDLIENNSVVLTKNITRVYDALLKGDTSLADSNDLEQVINDAVKTVTEFYLSKRVAINNGYILNVMFTVVKHHETTNNDFETTYTPTYVFRVLKLDPKSKEYFQVSEIGDNEPPMLH